MLRDDVLDFGGGQLARIVDRDAVRQHPLHDQLPSILLSGLESMAPSPGMKHHRHAKPKGTATDSFVDNTIGLKSSPLSLFSPSPNQSQVSRDSVFCNKFCIGTNRSTT